MTPEDFAALVARLEAYAPRHPVAYRVRLTLLALLGYAYIWLILVVLVTLLVVLAWLATSAGGGAVTALLKLGWPVLLLIVAIVRALWVTFPRPEGVPLRPGEAPRLVALVDDLRRRLACPRFHHILLTDEWNAAVSQRPRLGPLGWYDNYLQLGVPLMTGLPPDEFRAVLAHEFGHLSRSHGRFGSWIYRIRSTWIRLLEGLHASRHGWRGLFEAFLNRFAPYFNAYSFVLARAREYEADRVAGQLVGNETMCRALVRLNVGGALLGRRYWPAVERLSHDEAEPPEGVISRLASALRAGPDAAEAREWLDSALQGRTGTEDTHPSLSDRVAALGFAPDAVRAMDLPGDSTAAADEYLGDLGRATLSQLDSAWRRQALSAWQQRHAAVQRGRARLQEIEARATGGGLTPDLAWERIELTFEVRDAAAAEPLLRDLLAANADHVGANFVLGRMLLQRRDAVGVEHLERAMQRHPGSVPPGCHLVAEFFEAEGNRAEAARYRARGHAGAELLQRASAERQGVGPEDTLLPHDLSPDAVERLRQEMKGFFGVRRAYLARKAVQYLPEQPYYVLGLVLGRWYQFRTLKENVQLVHDVATKVSFPGPTRIIALGRRSGRIKRKLKGIKGAELLLT